MQKQLPTVTVVIATYNSEKTIDECLQSVRDQNYPQSKIDIILADGGSIDSTHLLVRKYNVTFIKVPKNLQNAEYNKGVGVRKATGELILMVDHDNVLPHRDWLKKMIYPLIDDKSIVGVETLRYQYDPKYSLLDRYLALFGAGDPLAFYLGKSDRLSYIFDKYNLYGKAVRVKNYYKVTFSPDKIPTIGANGFIVRKNILLENAQVDPTHFFHIDVNADLIRKGFNTYAFIEDGLIHHTGYKKISSFLKRRILFVDQFYDQQAKTRRYSLYEPKDFWKLMVFLIYSLTFVKPLYDSVRGYRKVHDFAWFLHPILCFSLTIIYGIVTIKNFAKNYEF